MANDAKRPRIGELAVNTTELAGQLVDLPKGPEVAARNQPGLEKAKKEIRDKLAALR